MQGTRYPRAAGAGPVAVFGVDTMVHGIPTNWTVYSWGYTSNRMTGVLLAVKTALIDACTKVTVLTDTAMLADAWATALLVLGRERGLEIAEREGIAALFIDRGADGFVTTASKRFATATA